MKRASCYLVGSLMVVLMCGCSAMLVPATNDPHKKIEYAYMLLDEQGRPLPAEKLIQEAIYTYKAENNELGLAEAYRAYGFFFRSKAVDKHHKHYESNGFLDKSATFYNRYDKSVEYFNESVLIYSKYNKTDMVINVYLNMGFSQEFDLEFKKACDSYKASLDSYYKFMKSNPNGYINLPKGFTGNYEDYIDGFLKRLDCK